jgi:hypothetical protein
MMNTERDDEKSTSIASSGVTTLPGVLDLGEDEDGWGDEGMQR